MVQRKRGKVYNDTLELIYHQQYISVHQTSMFFYRVLVVSVHILLLVHNWDEWLIPQSAVQSFRRTQTGWRDGQRRTVHEILFLLKECKENMTDIVIFYQASWSTFLLGLQGTLMAKAPFFPPKSILNSSLRT